MSEFDFKNAPLSPGFRAVEAGAGTGKTYSLMWIVVRLLLEGKQAREILMVTFTDAAALEMRQRLRERLESIESGNLEPHDKEALAKILENCSRKIEMPEAQALAGKALNQLGRMSITTIHGFCQSAFAEHAVNAGFAPMEGTPVDGGVVAEAIAADWFRCGRAGNHKLSDITRAIRTLMSDPDCDVSSIANGNELSDFVAKRLEESPVVTFDDLILRLRNALIPAKSGKPDKDDDQLARAEELTAQLRKSYSCCLIDEFQDTDAAQWAIFNHLFAKDAAEAGTLLMVVGDPKQAIYGFRGADLHTYLQAIKQSEGGAGSSLLQNRRSSEDMIAFFNALFGHRGYFGTQGIGYAAATIASEVPPDKKPVRLIGGKESEAVAGEVARLLAENPEGTVGVLVRSNRLGNTLHRALVEQGTPAALESTLSVYETTTAFQASLLLRAVLRPGDASARKALLICRPALFGKVPDTVLDAGADQSDDNVLRTHNAIAGWLSECRESWDKFGFTACWEQLTRQSPGADMLSVRESLAGSHFRSRALIDLSHIGEHLASIQATRRLDPEQVVAYIQQRVEQAKASEEGEDEDAAPDECLRLESAKPKVVVQTIHKSKGLEYDSVVLVIQRPKKAPTFPGNVLRGGEGRKLTMGDPDKDRSAAAALSNQCRDEDARLLYVAITRAKYRLSVFNDKVPANPDPSKEHGFHRVLRESGIDPATWRTADPDKAPRTGLKLDALVELVHPPKREEPAKQIAKKEKCLVPIEDKAGPQKQSLRLGEQSYKLAYARGATSFSGLTKKLKHKKAEPLLERGEDEDDDDIEGEQSKSLLVPDAIKGTGFGIVIHELLEVIDFKKGDADPDALAEDIAARLAAESLSLPEGETDWTRISNQLARSCKAWLDAKLLTDVARPGHRVRDIERGKCLHEVRFAMRGKCDKARLEKLTAAFATEFADHTGLAALKVAELDLDGILTGVLDLAYEHNKRFYVLDWKTNHLGNDPDDYAEAGLANGIANSAYHLQYSLYTAALDLHLRNVLGDKWTYDPADAKPGQFSFGGVQYVFLRAYGLKPDGLGCHFRRPSKTFISAIQKILTQ